MRYEGGLATLLFEDGDTGWQVQLRVPTDCLYSEVAAETDTTHVQLARVADALPVDPASGRFVAPPGFGPQMAVVREGLHLGTATCPAGLPRRMVRRAFARTS